MSTTIEIERMPASFSLVAIQSGTLAFASIPEIPSSTNWLQPSRPWIGIESLTFRPKPDPDNSLILELGSVNFDPVACEYSRAIPRIERQ